MQEFTDQLEAYLDAQSDWMPRDSKRGFKNMINAYKTIESELGENPNWEKIVDTCSDIRNMNGSFWGHLAEMREAGGERASEAEALYRSLHENLEVIRVCKDMPLDIVLDQLAFPEDSIPDFPTSTMRP
ncbi:hypothetical protein [Sulfitobacter sp. R18_1]|uniref:hypothetical protein n=1 Tax=Sulfitobacter sp. R18_1 TaxID=2821104 RepID=UPI001ADAF68E|nr:hypothetical protein [Sulfitobacter sp. R18_1]MBO9428342.1 hypothetical protein [Sulfitobacter sp. R18_1]